MPNFYLWTVGCQMNKADSERLAGYLRGWGYEAVTSPEAADVAVVNSCAVRQSAQDRVTARLNALGALKRSRPGLRLALTGCMVAPGAEWGEQFPELDLCFAPQDFSSFNHWMGSRPGRDCGPSHPAPSAFVPVIHGCDNFCTYCVVPYRRGREKSRPVAEVVAEVRELVGRGVREVVLLGQNVNSYGHDLPGQPDLADLLRQLSGVDGLGRIRFLTSHPRDITEKFIQTVAALDKVCPSFSLPIQAGDDGVLTAMGRGYTVAQYRELVRRIREAMPQAGLSTDVIVGFPGESEAAFGGTCSLLEELRFDTVHIASYSPRPGTISARTMKDSVPSPEKKRRQRWLEALQRQIAAEEASRLVGQRVEVLVESFPAPDKARGRTPPGRLVFFPAPQEMLGQEVQVSLEAASPWWLEGTLSKLR